MLKTTCIIVAIVIFIVIGYGLGNVLPYKIFYPNIDWSKTISPGDYYYYSINTIQTVATIAAVIVALFKETILCKLRYPVCKMELIDDGIIEVIDSEQPDPKANAYECFVKINNVGKSAVHGGEIIISQVSHAFRKDHEKKIIRNLTKSRLKWESSRVTIPPKNSKEILLFKITSPQNYGTPSALDTQYSPTGTFLDFNGMKLAPQVTRRGVWDITFCLNYERGNVKHFMLSIEWDGTWKNRKTEMKEVLKINLKEI